MRVKPLKIPAVLLLTPEVHEDARGCFFESFNLAQFESAVGHPVYFVQDNHSQSRRHVVRGLHYQIKRPQGKLIRAVFGTVFDVAVDLRRGSPTFGNWVGVLLSAENKRQLWIPEGFAHGFATLSEVADVHYKCSNYYEPKHERRIRWDDPTLAIDWQLNGQAIVSNKDEHATTFLEADVFP